MSPIFKKLSQPAYSKLLALGILIISYVFLYKILIPRITAFGCFDDCFNFMGGYFLLHHKKLFSEIFYNHAPLMAYISMVIQWTTHPQNMYELILRHRQVLFAFGFIAEFFLILRFGIRIIPFVLLYEFTKFYLFGDRFLAESFIVYPLIYMSGVFFQQMVKKTEQTHDVFLSAICAWFVIFMREPYAFTALLLFAAILLKTKNSGKRMLSVILLIVVSLITIFSHSFNDFIFNVVTVNARTLSDGQGINIYKSLLYPFFILFQNNWSFFGSIEFALTIIFLIETGYFLWRKQYVLSIFIWVVLATANLRLISPGSEFYASFHLLPWYALFLFIIISFLFEINYFAKRLSAILSFALLGIFFSIFTKSSYIHDSINQQNELINNFGIPMQVGNVANALSQPTDTLFLDGYDDIIYFVAHRYSPYKYSWYTSVMPDFSVYTKARIAMFKKTPPDFYYGNCPKEERPYYLLPDFVKNDYIRLYNQEKPSCLWVKKSKLASITSIQWQKAGEQLYFSGPHQ